MRFNHRFTRPLLSLAAAAMLVAACGGAASPSPAASTAASATPSETPASASPSASPAASLDLSGAAKAIDKLTGYQLDATIKGAVPGASGMDGTFKLTAVVDRKNNAYDFTMAGMEGLPASGLKVVVIGNDAWVDLGTGSYIKQTGGAAQFGASLDAFEPSTLLSSIPPAALMFMQKVGDEQKNGVQTAHYHMDGSNPEIAQSLGSDADVDFWIASDGGYLVSMKVKGEVDANGTKAPLDMSLDVSRVNDSSINIQPPS